MQTRMVGETVNSESFVPSKALYKMPDAFVSLFIYYACSCVVGMFLDSHAHLIRYGSFEFI